MADGRLSWTSSRKRRRAQERRAKLSSVRSSFPPFACLTPISRLRTLFILRCRRDTCLPVAVRFPNARTHRDERDGRGGNGCNTGAAIFCVHCSRPPVSHSQSHFHLYRAHPVSISCLPYSLPNSEHPAPARRPGAADRQAAHAPLVPHVPEPNRVALALREPLRQLPASRMGRAHPAHAPGGERRAGGGQGAAHRLQGEERVEAPHQDVQYVPPFLLTSSPWQGTIRFERDR